MEPRLRASPHSGARKFFLIFIHQSAAGESLRGRRPSSYLNNKKVPSPSHGWNTTIFIGNTLESQTKANMMNNRFSW